jgi:hypothetical protein
MEMRFKNDSLIMKIKVEYEGTPGRGIPSLEAAPFRYGAVRPKTKGAVELKAA